LRLTGLAVDRRVIATPAHAERAVSAPPQSVSVATIVQCQSFMIAQEVNS
jgi:hypothetical protein